jgi:hypothetical protein
MHDEEKLVTIAEYENGFDAELAKVTLEHAGISAVILGEDISTIKPYSSTPFNVELQVFEKDVEQAKQVLAEKQPLEDSDDIDSDEETE